MISSIIDSAHNIRLLLAFVLAGRLPAGVGHLLPRPCTSDDAAVGSACPLGRSQLPHTEAADVRTLRHDALISPSVSNT